MARIDSTQLVRDATNVGSRLYQVQQDPAVQKAWRAAGDEAVRTVQSVAMAAFETRSSWRRTGTGGGAAFTGHYA